MRTVYVELGFEAWFSAQTRSFAGQCDTGFDCAQHPHAPRWLIGIRTAPLRHRVRYRRRVWFGDQSHGSADFCAAGSAFPKCPHGYSVCVGGFDRLWLVHVAVCEQMLEEQGIEVDENDINEMKHLYCKKLEYDDMIKATLNED